MFRFLLTGLLFAGLLLITSGAMAQPPGAVPGQPNAEMMAKMKAAHAAAKAGNSGKPEEPGNKDAAKEGSKDGDEKKGDKKSSSPEVVKRPEDPGFTVDPSELEVKPVNGKVRFNFHGQPWQGVLEWLAAISGMSLDWQQLPGDYLNLRTQRAYTIPETRDLINQHLLARGYTILRHDNVLRVVKLSELEPALVPRVPAEKLGERDPHEFVQTIFQLEWIPAATAEKELKPLLSPHGELAQLSTTNRLHAMDAVTNLITIRDLLAEEQSNQGESRLVRSFPLKHARAEDVKKALEELLGIEQSGGTGPMDPRQRQQMQQMQQRMRQMQQRNGNKGAAPPKQEKKASIIANPRKNEIIATAPPETMQIIEQTVKLLDAPPQYEASFQTRLRRIQGYRLDQLDAATFTEMLRDLGGISPLTTITTDEDNNTIIVNGELADHLVVQQVIEKLDGSQRTFKVIRLRRLPAAYVAGTISLMMGPVEEEENNNDRFSFYGYGNNNNDDEEDSSGQFRVEADTANNRLLIRATPIEMEEIHNLLVQLGEIRPADQVRSNTRVLNLTPEQTDVFLKRLQEYWPADKTNPLKIDPELRSGSDDSNATDEQESVPSAEPGVPAGDSLRAGSPSTIPIRQTAGIPTEDQTANVRLIAEKAVAHMMLRDELPPSQTSPASPLGGTETVPDAPLNEAQGQATDPFTPRQRPGFPDRSRPNEPAPVIIKRAPGGGLIIQSDDPAALNAIEDLMYELAPEPKSYHVFPLKYPTTVPFYVVLNLETFFGVYEEDEDGGSRGYYYYRYGQDEQAEDPLSLGQRGELTFIPDADSHTIIVQNATAAQLETIKELIAIYDQPPARNPGDVRVTRIFNLQRAKAADVAEAVKAVYRDLLSANDTAFQRGQRRGEGEQRGGSRRGGYFSFMRSEEDSGEPEKPITFKGLLSIGIEESSNTIIVSASQRIIEQVSLLIDALDEAASGEKAMSVVRTGGGGLPPNLAKQLEEIFGDQISINGSGASTDPANETSTGTELRQKTISPQLEESAAAP